MQTTHSHFTFYQWRYVKHINNMAFQEGSKRGAHDPDLANLILGIFGCLRSHFEVQYWIIFYILTKIIAFVSSNITLIWPRPDKTFLQIVTDMNKINFAISSNFSKHRPSGPMLSISQNVRPSVCVSVTCVSSRHSRKCVTLLKLMTEIIFSSKLLEHPFSDYLFLKNFKLTSYLNR